MKNALKMIALALFLGASASVSAPQFPKRGMFEKTQQYQARLNQGAKQHDQRYQAGVAYLEDYDADSEMFTVRLDWQAVWVKEFFDTEQAKKGLFKIPPNQAQAVWNVGKEKPLFVTVAMVGERLKLESIILVERGQVWNVATLRYVDNGDGTVIDFRSGLVWLKNANCFRYQDWKTAMQSASHLGHGKCGLSDGSKAGDWRLPTKEEWKAMVDNRYKDPALSNAVGTGQWKEDDVFMDVQSSGYWSSSTDSATYAWRVSLSNGSVYTGNKTNASYVWSVRDGH